MRLFSDRPLGGCSESFDDAHCRAATGKIGADDLGGALVLVSGWVIALVLARFVESPILIDVTTGSQGAQLQHRLCASQPPVKRLVRV